MPRYRKLNPGDTFTAGELNKLAAQLTGATGEGAGGLSVDAGSSGTNVVDNRTPPVWGRITGGSNPYSWVQVNETEESTFPDLTGDFALAGTTTSLPAYDVDEATDVQIGDKVLLHLAASQDKWLFKSGVLPTGCDGNGPGWVAGLLTTECGYLEVLRASGECDQIDTTQTAYMRWSGGLSKWVSQEWDCVGDAWIDKDFVTDPDSSPMYFWIDAGRPRMQISGITYDLVMTCGGNGVIVFAGGTTATCTDGTPVQCNNTFLVRFTCICCPIDGWQGAGWYCTKAAGGDCTALPGTVLELFETDKCSTEFIICSCRYATEAEANAQCGIAFPAPCQSLNFSTKTVVATFSNKTGDCTCLPATGTTSGTGVDTVSVTTASCPGNIQLDLSCSGGVYVLTTGTGGITTLCTAFTAAPFSITFHVTGYGANCGGSGGTADLTITAT